MKDLVIIGAGGMGKTIFNLALTCREYNKEYTVKGFLDDNLSSMRNCEGYPPVIGTVANYIPLKNDVFICSMGDVRNKKKCVSLLKERGGKFISLVSPLAQMNTNARIGEGTIIGAYSSIGCDAHIGNHVLIQTLAVVGHDVEIGDWSRIDTHTTCVGGVRIGNEVVVHTGAIINHKVVIENNACIGAGSFVIRKVDEGKTVYGNPAKVL